MSNIDQFPKEFNIIPVKSLSKEPLVKWMDYQKKKYPRDKIINHRGNYAVLCGETSNNLLILDLDFKNGYKNKFNVIYDAYKKEFPELVDTYIVSTPHGYHLYYYMKNFLETRHPNPNRISKKSKTQPFPVFIGTVKTNYYQWLKGWDILGQNGYAIIPPSKLKDAGYTSFNGNSIKSIDSNQFELVKKFFLMDTVKQVREPFVDILNGRTSDGKVMEIESYAVKYGKDEHLYWKGLFFEVYYQAGLQPKEIYSFLEKNQPAFDKKKTEQLLKYHYNKPNGYWEDKKTGKKIPNKPYSNAKMKELFPSYVFDDGDINSSLINEIILKDLNIKTEFEELSKYELRDIVLENYNIKTLYENGEFCMFDNGVYLRNQNRRLESIISQFFEEFGMIYTSSRANDVLQLIAHNTYVSIENFDKNPYILNLNNGLLNVKTLEFREDHDPNYLSFRRIPIIYDPKAVCPNIESFIKDVFKKDDNELIYEISGLSLTPDMDFQKAFLFYGTGNNGKTTYFNLMIDFIGKSNCSDVDLSQLHNPHLLSEIEGKLLNILPDIDSSTKLRIQMFKNYVGNASFITINKKYKDPYQIKPTAKMMYSCNTTFPLIPKDTDKGFFRKWILIECPNEFDNKEDSRMLEKLTTEEELSGLLNKSVEGLRRLLKRQKFEDKYNNWEEVKELWFLKINDFADFVSNETEIGTIYIADKIYTLKKFNEYLKKKGKKPVSQTMITKFINESPNYFTDRITFNGKQERVYKGFRLDGDRFNLYNKKKEFFQKVV